MLAFFDSPRSELQRYCYFAGLDTSNFLYYQNFVHKNNFHGLALSLCDVDELKKELKTSFGDWCLIKRFISETKRNMGKHKVGCNVVDAV